MPPEHHIPLWPILGCYRLVNKVQVIDTLDGRLLKSCYHKDLHALHFGILLCCEITKQCPRNIIFCCGPFWGCYKLVSRAKVMDAPTLLVSAEKNLGDPIEIIVDIVYPALADVFPTATVVRTLAQHRMGMAEEENASLCGRIKTIEAIDTITRRQEKRGRMELERQIMPTTRQGSNVVMTLEVVQAMIDQTLLRNNTTDDGSQNSNEGPRRPMQPARAALTWWNGHVRTLGHDAAYAMTWEILKKKLTDKYCPKGKTKKLEIKLWNLKVKGNELEVDKYISRLSDNVHGNVMSARPKTLDDAIELANYLMDQKLRTYAERQTENKRKLDNNNQAQQQLLKKQNVVQAYAVGPGGEETVRRI
nr:hypothetical protein [Tanacetum cinerariifolium]